MYIAKYEAFSNSFCVPGLGNIHCTYFVVICLAKEFQCANVILIDAYYTSVCIYN